MYNILATKGSEVKVIRYDKTVREAISSLVSYNIGALVVEDDEGKPIGIISERDIIRKAAEEEGVFSLKVSEVMTGDIIKGTPNDDIESVANTMTERRIRHLLIYEEGKMVGIVSIGDVLKAERDRYRGEIDTLQSRIVDANS